MNVQETLHKAEKATFIQINGEMCVIGGLNIEDTAEQSILYYQSENVFREEYVSTIDEISKQNNIKFFQLVEL